MSALARPPGRRALRAAVLAAPLLLAGCLVADEEIRIEADGSGRMRQVFTLDRRARDGLLQALARLYGADALPGPAPAADPLAPAWFTAAARQNEGYRIVEVVRREVGERLETTVESTFDDLAAAARAGAFLASALRLERLDAGTWRLLVYDGWSLFGDVARRELGGRPLAVVREALREALGDLVLVRTFVLPGVVTQTNGQLAEDRRTVTWRVDLDRLAWPEGLSLEVRFRPVETENGGLQPFRHRVDPVALARRLLESPPVAPAPATPSGPGGG